MGRKIRMVVLVGFAVMCFIFVGNAMEVKASLNKSTMENVSNVSVEEKSVVAEPGCDARALQELLDLNEYGEYKLTVVIPKGIYNLTKTLYVHPNTIIRATGAKLVKQKNYGAILEVKLVEDEGGYRSNHDIIIDGGTWDSTPVMKSTEGTETFRFIHCSNIVVQNATLCNVPNGSHLIVFAGVKNATVSKCQFFGYGGDGITDPKEAIQLDVTHNKTLVPTLQDVKWDDLPCDTININNCLFKNYSRGIGSHTAVEGKLHSNVKILNNTFQDLKESAIRLYNYRDTVVRGNIIENAAAGVLVYTFMDNTKQDAYFKPNNGKIDALPSDYKITIADNTIRNMKLVKNTWGDAIRVMGKKERLIRGVDITGNVISNTERYGIYASLSPDISISGSNKISETKKDGILLINNCHKASVHHNKISTAKGSGIALYSSDNCLVYSNEISKATNYGIYLLEAKACKIGTASTTGNKITDVGRSGIYLSTTTKTGCTSTSVMYNVISNAKMDGIGAYKSEKIKIKSNKITSKGNGIYLNTNCISSSVQNNTIVSSGKNGIWVSTGGKKVLIEKNIVKKYGTAGDYYGIYLYKAGGTSGKSMSKIISNKIIGSGKGTKKDGIRFSSSPYSLISSNTIKSVRGCGIYGYLSKSSTVLSNTVVLPKTKGIWISRSDKTKIKSNLIKGKNKGNSLYLTKSSNCKVAKNYLKK